MILIVPLLPIWKIGWKRRYLCPWIARAIRQFRRIHRRRLWTSDLTTPMIWRRIGWGAKQKRSTPHLWRAYSERASSLRWRIGKRLALLQETTQKEALDEEEVESVRETIIELQGTDFLEQYKKNWIHIDKRVKGILRSLSKEQGQKQNQKTLLSLIKFPIPLLLRPQRWGEKVLSLLSLTEKA